MPEINDRKPSFMCFLLLLLLCPTYFHTNFSLCFEISQSFVLSQLEDTVYEATVDKLNILCLIFFNEQKHITESVANYSVCPNTRLTFASRICELF